MALKHYILASKNCCYLFTRKSQKRSHNNVRTAADSVRLEYSSWALFIIERTPLAVRRSTDRIAQTKICSSSSSGWLSHGQTQTYRAPTANATVKVRYAIKWPKKKCCIMSIDRQLWSRSLQRPSTYSLFKASCQIQDQSRQKHKQTERYKDSQQQRGRPRGLLKVVCRYRRPVPELIERHSAGQRHQHGGGGAQAAGVVEGVLLLPEPFIVVVLLSLFWMLLLPLSSVVVVWNHERVDFLVFTQVKSSLQYNSKWGVESHAM